MTLPASSFAEAKRLLRLFAEGAKTKPFVAEGGDVECIQYNIPDDSSDNMGAYHLVAAAMNIADRRCRMAIDGGHVLLLVPTHFEKLPGQRLDAFPLAQAEIALHDLRRFMLSGLRQEADGTISFSTHSPYPGLNNVDMRNMVQNLVNRNQSRRDAEPTLEVGAQYRNSEEAIARLKPNAMHRQSLSRKHQRMAAKFVDDYDPRRGSTLEMDNVRFDGEAALALYRELGVEPKLGRAN